MAQLENANRRRPKVDTKALQQALDELVEGIHWMSIKSGDTETRILLQTGAIKLLHAAFRSPSIREELVQFEVKDGTVWAWGRCQVSVNGEVVYSADAVAHSHEPARVSEYERKYSRYGEGMHGAQGCIIAHLAQKRATVRVARKLPGVAEKFTQDEELLGAVQLDPEELIRRDMLSHRLFNTLPRETIASICREYKVPGLILLPSDVLEQIIQRYQHSQHSQSQRASGQYRQAQHQQRGGGDDSG